MIRRNDHVQVFVLAGHPNFLCGVYADLPIYALQDIETATNEPEFNDPPLPDGTYTYLVRWDHEGYWDFTQTEFQPIEGDQKKEGK